MKIDKYILIFFGLAVLILWQGLLPGYIFGLDMVFGPEMGVVFGGDGFLNALPLNYLIYLLGLIIPIWLVQKIVLLVLFFNIGYFAFKYLPVGENKEAKMFSALIYLCNPFVYSRFLAGQWTHLMAYSLLPLFVGSLLKLKEKIDLKAVLRVFGSMFLISLFSIHFFVMVGLIFGGFALYLLIDFIARKKYSDLKVLVKNLIIGKVLFLVAISYWLVPALLRPQPIEQRLGSNHWEAFSAGGYKGIDTLLNVVSLNGFWGERNPWAGYFVWPQDSAIFWISLILIGAFVLIGIFSGLKNKKSRFISIFFGILTICSFVFATGASETIFKGLNVWLFENVSFWSGFRDSQKFSGLLALSYVFFAGLGFVAVYDYFKKKSLKSLNIFLSFVFVLPVLFGYLVWGGFYKQIKPVWYPDSWVQAKQVLDRDVTGKVLFLPWHGYLSLNFNNKVVSANPARRFFSDRIIAGRSVDLESIYNQDSDSSYLRLDSVVANLVMSDDEKIDIFNKDYDIKYIVKINDLDGVDNLSYGFLESSKLVKEFDGDGVEVYKVK